jgi:hypothetical protein
LARAALKLLSMSMHQQFIDSATVNCRLYIGGNGEYFSQDQED